MLRKGVKLLIKKMVDYKKALVAILENTLENVNAGNTNITEEEASVIIDHLAMLNKGVATVSKAYACEHVLHIGELEKEVAVLRATRPYQDALIQAAIARVAEQAEFNLFRRTCRMISGEVVLPNTPTVTGYSSYDPCACRATTPAPSAN